MTLTLSAIAHSEIGLVRKNNQDSGYVSNTMMLVCDGMGGAAAGDLASAVVTREMEKADHRAAEDPETVLSETVEKANSILERIIEEEPSFDGMGTTVCGGLFDGEILHIVHIGDSRGYIFRTGDLRRMTHDHSYVQSLIDDGRLNESEALTHPNRSLLLRVLNGQGYTHPDFLDIPLQLGDRVMFCSDGLCGLVSDERLAAILATSDPDKTMQKLIQAAHEASGSDNITIVLADVVESTDTPQPVSPHTEPTRVMPRSGRSRDEQPPLPLSAFTTFGLIGAAANPSVLAMVPGQRRVKWNSKQLRPSTSSGYVADDTHASKGGSPARFLWIIVVIVAALALIGGGVFATHWYIDQQYYVAESNGKVAIYQGIPGNIMGIQTSSLHQETAISLTDLPISYRDKVTDGITITSGGLSQAQMTVAELQIKANQCLAERADRPAGSAPGPDGC